jgi:membrane associated rhomboid family serine protease
MPAAMIPIGTDQDPKRRPVATMAIMGLTVVAHLAALAAGRASDEAAIDLVMRWGLSRTAFEWWQPVTYLFMHDPSGPWHLLGNMIFLWTFGSAVEGRMRRPGFVLFYLSGGAVAGFVQIALSPAPVIGASGAVSAVAGAFIVLFPRARVSVLFILSVVSLPAMLLVALYFALDLLGALGAGRGGIGHAAHLAGTVFGIAVTLGLLWTGAVRRTDMDLLYLMRQWARRREMRRALDGAKAGPWAPKGAEPGTRIAATGTPTAAEPPSAASLARAAARISEAARDAYVRGEWASAAEGFARAVATAPEAPGADESRLMIALIHVRKLPDAAKARAALDALGRGLPDGLRPLADALRAELAT